MGNAFVTGAQSGNPLGLENVLTLDIDRDRPQPGNRGHRTWIHTPGGGKRPPVRSW